MLKQGLIELVNDLAIHTNTVNLAIIGFARDADQALTFNNLTKENLPELLAKIYELTVATDTSGNTNYQAAFEANLKWLERYET